MIGYELLHCSKNFQHHHLSVKEKEGLVNINMYLRIFPTTAILNYFEKGFTPFITHFCEEFSLMVTINYLRKLVLKDLDQEVFNHFQVQNLI